MALPIQSDHVSHEGEGSEDREPFVHFFAHETRVVLRIIVLTLLGVTLLTMATFWFWAIIPAMVLLAAYFMLVIVGAIEHAAERGHADAPWTEDEALRRERAESVRPEQPIDPATAAQREIDATLSRRRTTLVLEILIGVGVLAFVIAAFFVPANVLLWGAVILFAYMLLVMMPIWLGWIEDDLDGTRERVEHEMHQTP